MKKLIHTQPEKIWKLISESQILSEWLMPDDLVPVDGHNFTFKQSLVLVLTESIK
jgi:uncharacterized protein YndB with AHSA1/START domain